MALALICAYNRHIEKAGIFPVKLFSRQRLCGEDPRYSVPNKCNLYLRKAHSMRVFQGRPHIMTCSLKDLPKKGRARVLALQGGPFLNQHLMDMGIQSNIIITLIDKLFFDSNYIVEVGNERLVLRKQTAQCLQVTTT